jgi:hypothetical protein
MGDGLNLKVSRQKETVEDMESGANLLGSEKQLCHFLAV